MPLDEPGRSVPPGKGQRQGHRPQTGWGGDREPHVGGASVVAGVAGAAAGAALEDAAFEGVQVIPPSKDAARFSPLRPRHSDQRFCCQALIRFIGLVGLTTRYGSAAVSVYSVPVAATPSQPPRSVEGCETRCLGDGGERRWPALRWHHAAPPPAAARRDQCEECWHPLRQRAARLSIAPGIAVRKRSTPVDRTGASTVPKG